MKKAYGDIDGYKWAVHVDDALCGDALTYYDVEDPDGEIFVDDFTSGPIEDAIEACKVAIEAHKSGLV